MESWLNSSDSVEQLNGRVEKLIAAGAPLSDVIHAQGEALIVLGS